MKYWLLSMIISAVIIVISLMIFYGISLVSAVMIPIRLMELGEEIGWRGYLLGFQLEKYDKKKAELVNSIE